MNYGTVDYLGCLALMSLIWGTAWFVLTFQNLRRGRLALRELFLLILFAAFAILSASLLAPFSE